MAAFKPAFTLKRLRGLLEKKSSDGTWKAQYFTAHKSKLYYQDPEADLTEQPPRASMDLLEGLAKIERKGEKLVLWVDETRRHILRACAAPADGESRPSLDDWELSLRERRLVARKLRDERAARRASRGAPRSPPRSARTPPRSARPAGGTPADTASPAAASSARAAAAAASPGFGEAGGGGGGGAPATSPGGRPRSEAEEASWRAFVSRTARTALEASGSSSAPPPQPPLASPHGEGARPSPGPRSDSAADLDAFLAADVDALSLDDVRTGLRATGCRALAGEAAALRRQAHAAQDRLLGRSPRRGRAPGAGLDDRDSDGDTDDGETDAAAREKIIAFYTKHNPTKVGDVDALIAKYRDVGVGASELLLAVQKKYSRAAAPRFDV